MNNIQDLINESKKTDFEKIQSLSKNWIKEWGPSFCGNIIDALLKGVNEGMKENKHKDEKFQQRCEKCLEELINKTREDIY